MEPPSQTIPAPPAGDSTTVRMQGAFPIVARIRKGSPKETIDKNGRQVEVMGKDLNDRFRVEFMPGTAAMQAAFYSVYGTFQPNIIKTLIPDTTVWNAFSWFNGAYLSRLIAKADDARFISLIDPDNPGRYLIKNGQPFRPFVPKEQIEFMTSGGKTVMLQVRSNLFLRVFLYQLTGHFVSFEVVSTSFYDRIALTAQLAAVQGLANFLYSGNAGRIPLVISRAEREVTWTRGNTGIRVKKWLIQIAPDPDWAERAAFPALRETLGVATAESMLTLPEPELRGELNPDDKEEAAPDSASATSAISLSSERLAELTPHSPSDWTTLWNVSIPALGASREQGLQAVEQSKGAVHAFKVLVDILAATEK